MIDDDHTGMPPAALPLSAGDTLRWSADGNLAVLLLSNPNIIFGCAFAALVAGIEYPTGLDQQ